MSHTKEDVMYLSGGDNLPQDNTSPRSPVGAKNESSFENFTSRQVL